MKIKLPNKKYIIYGTCCAAILAFLAIGIANIALTKRVTDRLECALVYNEVLESVSSVQAPPSTALYTLYECGGKIGIYDAKSDILIDIIDVLAISLPSADQKSLKKGIPIYSLGELAKIIDDFSS